MTANDRMRLNRKMKHDILDLLLALLLFVTLTVPPARAAESAAEEANEPAHVERNSEGQMVVALTGETIKRLDLKWETVKGMSLHPEIRAFGRVLDPQPLFELHNQLQSAEIAAAASSAEFERVQKLKKEDNASNRAVEQARANADRDELQVAVAKQQLRLTWGDALPEKELEKWLSDLIARKRQLIRLDLEAGVRLSETSSVARLRLPGEPEKSIELKLLGRLPAVSPRLQGICWLSIIDNAASPLPEGLAVDAFLPDGNRELDGVVVSRGAVLRTDGRTWVYAKEENTEYVRREITLDRPLTDGWFVTKGLKAGDEIVTQGAAALLSTELQFRTGGGDAEED